MSISNQLNELNTEKQKINIIANRSRLKIARDKNKINKKKKSLAKIFLTSNYRDIDNKPLFSLYEVYTIGGLAILNGLENYNSSVLTASYNEIIHKCINNPTLKHIIVNQGKKNYSEDGEIKKDIREKLYLINGVLIRAKEFILKSNLDKLHNIGNSQFIKMRKSKI